MPSFSETMLLARQHYKDCENPDLRGVVEYHPDEIDKRELATIGFEILLGLLTLARLIQKTVIVEGPA